MTLNTLVRCSNPDCKMPVANIQTADKMQLNFSFVFRCPFCHQLSGFKPESPDLSVFEVMSIHSKTFPEIAITGRPNEGYEGATGRE